MTKRKKITKGDIANAIHSTAADHVTAVAEDVFDENLQEYQSDINSTHKQELAKKANAEDVEQSFSEQTTKNAEQDAEIAKKANAEDVSSQIQTEQTRVNAELEKKLQKDNNSDSSISDGSDEFIVTDSNNHIALKVDKDGIKARMFNICDENGKVVKTITKELLDKIEITTSSLDSTKLPKDTDSDSSISDGSDEFIVTDSNNHIALKVDKDGIKARMFNICDENGKVVKTITKELLDKIEILSQNSDKYGNTCKLQEKKGTYYEISAFSIKNVEQDLKAEFSTNKSKFGERTLHLYVHGKEETELTSRTNRGTVEISFNTPIVVTESLSFWIYMPTKCFINHRFESIKNPDPAFDFVFSGDSFSESFSMIPQYSLSPSWMLFKVLNKNLRGKEITKVSLSITNPDTNPNMDIWLGCFVADQRFTPTINFNMDSDLRASVNSKFTDYLESNNIPANIVVRFGSDQMNDGQKIGRRLYFNGIIDAGVRNAEANIPTDSDSSQEEHISIMNCNYQKKIKGIRYYLENDIISDGNPTKPIIAAHCATNYIDDVLAQALKTCGYRIIRHGNSYNYRSYIDSESCFIGTIGIGFDSNIKSVSDLTNEWKNNIETNFKEYVDDLIEWGMVGSFFTHEIKTREELTAAWDSNASLVDVVEDCINYILEKENAGLIQFKTLDNIYYNSVGKDVYNN